jgi:hypothetical protein
LRWRLKLSLIKACTLEALESFLRDKLDYALSRQKFAADLTEILQVNLAEDQPEEVAQRLAREYAW